MTLLGQHRLAHYPKADGPHSAELRENRLVLEIAARWLASEGPPAGTKAECALEAGCGPGALLHAVAPLFPRGALGLDLRVGPLRLARRVLQEGRAFLARRVEGRRFEAEAFPAVLASSLLDTVPEPFVAIGQLDALLAPGGLLLVGTPYS